MFLRKHTYSLTKSKRLLSVQLLIALYPDYKVTRDPDFFQSIVKLNDIIAKQYLEPFEEKKAYFIHDYNCPCREKKYFNCLHRHSQAV